MTSVRNFIRQSQDEYQRQLDPRNRIPIQQRKPTIYTFAPLTVLTLYIACYNNPTFYSFPFPPTLTRLTLDVYSSACITPLDFSLVFRMCLQLEYLSAAIQVCPGLFIAWGQPFQADHDQPLSFRELVLKQCTIQQSSLENLLTFTPRLKFLKLIGMTTSNTGAYN
ncbi:hypothetical protein BGX29_004144 [Mortierella sp. GBA35]|nr:hypothetical protein BGX29_004144 [Mortierella sp. GBA35]